LSTELFIFGLRICLKAIEKQVESLIEVLIELFLEDYDSSSEGSY
jgi:hypothetical protein